jgi:hypothetical protein
VRVSILKTTKSIGRAYTRVILFSAAVSAFLLVGPATAGAQQVDTTDAQYNSTLQLLQSGSEPPPGSSSSSGLPFTGLDVVALFAVGAALALAGYLLWRRSRVHTGEAGA